MKSVEYAVIGAGPAGSYISKKLALRGVSVSVFEKEPIIGKPIQCTGLLTNRIREFVNVNNDFVLNELNQVRIHSSNEVLTLPVNDFVVDRQGFDNYLKKESEKCGVKYYLNHELTGFKKAEDGVCLKFKNGTEVLTRTVIGCDGPLSKVNELFGLNPEGDFFFGKQFVVSKEFNDSYYDAYFNNEFSDFFAWRVPVNSKVSRIGVGSLNAEVVNNKLEFLRKMLGVKKNEVKEVNAGLIPVHNPSKRVFKEINNASVYLLGDAAGIVKATTGGGIIPCFKMINESYSNILKREGLKFGRTRLELTSHLLIRGLINGLNQAELDELFRILDCDSVKKVLKEYNRDNSINLVKNLLMNKPELLKFIHFL